MRARNLKPSLFRNRHLAPADPIFTVIFEGLWCIADREGRLIDDVFQIHLDINPARAFETTEKSLEWLVDRKFIYRYKARGFSLIQVVKFGKHQNPHFREADSVLPPPDWNEAKALGFEPYIYEQKPGASPGLEGHAPPSHQPKAGLIPDSGFRIPDSFPPTPHEGGVANAQDTGRKRKSATDRRDEREQLEEQSRLQKLMDRRGPLGMRDFRDPNPGESSDDYAKAQNAEHEERLAEASRLARERGSTVQTESAAQESDQQSAAYALSELARDALPKVPP